MIANTAILWLGNAFLCAHFSQTAPQQQLQLRPDFAISTKDVDKFVDYRPTAPRFILARASGLGAINFSPEISAF
jgi:hypothetical protein